MNDSSDTPLLALAAYTQAPAGSFARWERGLLWGSSLSGGVTFVAGVITKYVSPVGWRWVTLAAGIACMLLGFALSIGSAVGVAAPFAQLVANPGRFLLRELDARLKRERDQIAELAKRFDQNQLDHAYEHLS